MAFPPNLSNVERCFVHQVAQEMGLKTKSFGKNEDRYLTVFKQSEPTTFEDDIKYCSLNIKENIKNKLEDFLDKNPLNQEEMDILQQFSTSKIEEERSSKLFSKFIEFLNLNFFIISKN